MARKKPDRQGIVIQLQGLEKKHLQATDRYSREVSRLYDEATRELASLAGTLFEPDPNKPFSFADYPQTAREATTPARRSSLPALLRASAVRARPAA